MKLFHLGLAVTLSVLTLGCGKSASTTFNKAAGGPAAKEKEAAAGAQPVVRKIIYTATIELVVENIDTSEKDLRHLVEGQKGAYIAQAEMRGSPGSPRSGSWTIRIPVEQFDSFRQSLLKLGEVQRDQLMSEDVTDQFYDLDARIKNNKAREESLRKLLEKAGENKIEDYLAVQQKLDQVTAELEVQKGQLQRLDKLSTLATVNVTFQERKGYVRPEAPGFGSRIRESFGNSIDALEAFGQGAVIVSVVLAPWLLVFGLFASPLIWFLRRRRRLAPVMTVPPPLPDQSVAPIPTAEAETHPNDS